MIDKKIEYVINLDYKWMSLDLMSKVYSTLPDVQAPEVEVDGLTGSKSEIVNKPPKKQGLFSNFNFNPFKKSHTKVEKQKEE